MPTGKKGAPFVLLSAGLMEQTARNIYRILCEHDDASGIDHRFRYVPLEVKTFSNGEKKVKITETVRRNDAYILYGLAHPDPNNALMELMVAIDAAARASVRTITLVLPFIPYMRQDRKDESRAPISARMVADMLEMNAAVRRILTIDMHVDQAQGFFRIPVDNLYGATIHSEHFKQKYAGQFDQLVVMSPDVGGVQRARRFRNKIDPSVRLNIIDKQRKSAGEVDQMIIIGDDYIGRDVVLYDDMFDTCGTLILASSEITQRGARSVCAAGTHGIFSVSKGSSAEEKCKAAGLRVISTTSIARRAEYYRENEPWLTALPIDKLVAEAIYESSIVGGSVSGVSDRDGGML
jgi:ribose-phosphate pyrophosphokinase